MDFEIQVIINELQQPRTEHWLNEISESSMKSSIEAKKLRKLGNELYLKLVTNSTNLEMEKVYKLYSESVTYALPNSDDLALAFGNRSALLSRMKKYKECISDIDRALKISQSNTYKIKLLCRKMTSLSLVDSSESKIIQTEIENLILKFDDKDTSKKSLNDIFIKAKLTSKQSKQTNNKENSPLSESVKVVSQKLKENLFDSVSVSQDEKYGRYLVANRNFKAGEIIFIELPYVEIINLKNSYLYCSHCFTTSWSSIPCDYCTWCMFCSDKCKAEAWAKYHDIECIIVSQMFNTKAGKTLLQTYQRIHLTNYFMLSIKSLIIRLKQVGSINSLKEELKVADKLKDNCTKIFQTDDFESARFKHLYMLNDHVSNDRLKPYAISSILILFYLIKCTSLFKDSLRSMCYKDIAKQKKVIFIGSLLLKLHKISDINIQNIPGENFHKCKYSNDFITCNLTDCCIRGSCINPINSLINHHCDPNVMNLVTYQQKAIVYSLIPIKKNSQIFRAYQDTFYEIPKQERQMMLKHGFNFNCDCRACEENWPTLTDIMANPVQHKIINPIDIQYLFIEDAIVRPIMSEYENVKCDQKTIATLSKALAKVVKNVNQPSISIWKLKKCIQGAFEKIYENC